MTPMAREEGESQTHQGRGFVAHQELRGISFSSTGKGMQPDIVHTLLLFIILKNENETKIDSTD
jgi:hypothetical protein